eukprot:9565341-Ditylum_brightwellii.AAC.1
MLNASSSDLIFHHSFNIIGIRYKEETVINIYKVDNFFADEQARNVLALFESAFDEFPFEEFKEVVGQLFQTIEAVVQFENMTFFKLNWQSHLIQTLPTL